MSPPADRPAATPLVVLHVWGVPRRHVPAAVLRMGLDRALLRRAAVRRAGLGFHKLLGTGDGRTFTVRDADPGHWALLSCWRTDDEDRADASTDDERVQDDLLARVESTATVRGWDRLAHERLRVVLRPVSSRGTWAGRQPFGDPRPRRPAAAGPVASITRARLRPRLARTFWRAVPPVSADLQQVPGLRLAIGVGEAPIGLQGTFSLWDDARSLDTFAYRRPAHTDAVRRTGELDWYAEELFARFQVVSVDGTFGGEAP